MSNYDILKEYEEHQEPIPTYEELQNMNKVVNECMAANIKLVEENSKLKELLDKAFKYVHQDCLKNLRVGYTPTSCLLLKDIKEVLKDYRRKNAIEFLYVEDKQDD